MECEWSRYIQRHLLHELCVSVCHKNLELEKSIFRYLVDSLLCALWAGIHEQEPMQTALH